MGIYKCTKTTTFLCDLLPLELESTKNILTAHLCITGFFFLKSGYASRTQIIFYAVLFIVFPSPF